MSRLLASYALDSDDDGTNALRLEVVVARSASAAIEFFDDELRIHPYYDERDCSGRWSTSSVHLTGQMNFYDPDDEGRRQYLFLLEHRLARDV